MLKPLLRLSPLGSLYNFVQKNQSELNFPSLGIPQRFIDMNSKPWNKLQAEVERRSQRTRQFTRARSLCVTMASSVCSDQNNPVRLNCLFLLSHYLALLFANALLAVCKRAFKPMNVTLRCDAYGLVDTHFCLKFIETRMRLFMRWQIRKLLT